MTLIERTRACYDPGIGGISGYYGLSFIVGHAVWSICIPIAIVEMLATNRRAESWLGIKGLVATVVFYLVGCWIIYSDLQTREEFMASPKQLLGAASVALGLIGAAFFVRKDRDCDARTAPRPWLVGLAAFALANAFFLRPENWFGVGFGILVLGIAIWLALRWSRRRDWSVWHEFALVAGALPTYMAAGFILTATIRPDDRLAWIGNALFALVVVALLLITAKRIRGAAVTTTSCL